MRSNLVFEAVHTLRNRYMLCQLASKATRRFHRPATRIQDTTNEILNKIASSDRNSVVLEPVNANEGQRRAAQARPARAPSAKRKNPNPASKYFP